MHIDCLRSRSEPAYRELSTLHEASLKREVKRLLTELSEARAQLGDMAAERQQLRELLANSRTASSQLQGKLRERISDSEGLRKQIDSIHASICWRVTSPIRWFHKQVRARNTLLKRCSWKNT